jgi:CHAT domain-containing protein
MAIKFFENTYETDSVKLKDTLTSLGEHVALSIEKKLDTLEGIERVIYLPSSYLNYLPLEACGKRTPLSERYIFERFTHLSSLQKKQQRDTTTEQSLLSIINPTSDLSYSAREGEVVNRLFKKVESLSEQDASKEALSHKLDKGNFTYLYFTGHGSFDMSNPLNSALILSDGNYTIRDMLSQKHYRDVRLAFLSACETNMPDIDMLSEMISIPQALLETGTERVISTLYQVDERATMFLTIKFFELYIHQERDAPQALAMAKAWLRSASTKELIDISIRYMRKYNTMSRDHIKLRQLVEHFTYDFHENDKPYNNPKYWAGFISNGSGVK